MANIKCEVCGNEYDGAFEVRLAGETHVFDSFECAIHRLAPRCAQCGAGVIGHGLQSEELIFCSAHCATTAGKEGFRDRIGRAPTRSVA